MEVNNTRKLYDALKSDGYTDLGDFSSFEGKLKDSGKREMLYDVLKKDGWQDLGDFSQFESKLGYAPINNENIKETDYVSQSSVNPPPISLRQEVDIPKSDQSEYVNPWDNSADYNFESLRKKGKIETATPPPPTEYEKDSSFMNTWVGDAIQKLNAGGADLGAGIFGVLDKAAKGLESATGGLIPRGGAFKDISDRFKADAEFSRARSNRYNGKDFTDLWKEGNYMGAIGDIALQGVESLPMSIGAMAATMAGAPAAGLAGIGSIVASQKYDDLDQNNPNMGEFAKVSNAILTGTAESLSEMLGAGVSKAWMSTLFKTLGKEKAQEAIKRGIMGKMQEFYKKFGMFFEPVNEGIEEVSSTLAENITDKITGADPERDLTDGVLQSFVYGMGGGAYFTGAGALAKGAQYVADKIGGKQAQQPITDSNVTDQGVGTPPLLTKSRFAEAEEEGRNMTDPGNIRTASKKMEETRLSLSEMVPGLASTIESYVDDKASEAQVMSLLDGVNADARPLAEDFYADYLRISGLQDRIGEEIDNEVETYVANNITPYVTTNPDGQSIVTTATLSDGNVERPVYIRSIEGDKAVISDNGQDRMVSVKRLSDIVEQDAGHMRRTYEDQLLATRQSELDMTMHHNPKTQLPKPGLIIWNGDNAFILQGQDENGDWIAQPAAYDRETGQVTAKNGSSPAMPITENEILDLQDAIYDAQQVNVVSPEDDNVESTDAEITSAPTMEDAINQPTSEIETEGAIDQIAQPSNVENPSMVMREDGTPDFVSSGTDMALDFLYDKYGDKMPRKIEVTRKSFDESLKKAYDALEKAQEAYDDAPIGKEDKAEAALIKARQEYEAIKVEADFWANLDDDIKEASKKPGDVIAKEISVMGDPMSGEELAAMMLANGAIKLTRDSYKKETGAGNNETARMFGLFASPEKGGVNIERAGEILELADRENGTNFFDENDTNAGRDAIIEVLSSAHTRGDLIDYVKRNREAIAERERQAEYNAYAEWCEENYHMSPEEYEAYEESMARDFSEKQLTDEERGELDSQIVDEIQAIIDEQNEIDAILAQNKPIENENIEGNDESGGDGLREGGGEVLPREQLDQTGGTGEVEGRESAGPDIDRTDGATQEGSSRGLVPFVAPSPKENETPLDYAERIVEAKRLHEEELKVDTNPTEAQKEAGNYKKGHIKINGFDITIEQPSGSVRSGKDANGKEWSVTMNNTYGYIRGTESVDGDHIDVFLGPDMNSDIVYVVDQVNTDGSFDEHKVMMGFSSLEDARSAYLSNYEEGWQGLGNITGVALDEFKKWIDSSTRKTKSFSEYKGIKREEDIAPRKVKKLSLVDKDDYITSAERKHIKAFLESGLKEARVNNSIYEISNIGDDGVYEIVRRFNYTDPLTLVKDENGKLVNKRGEGEHVIRVKPTFEETRPDSGIRFRETRIIPEEENIIKKAKSDGSYMKAPNGNPTNLNEKQWVQVRTKAFKEWFGDWENNPEDASKVIDENGEPRVVYHGTYADFNAFDESHLGDVTNLNATNEDWAKTSHIGFWFNDNKIGFYTKHKPVFLNVRNPLEFASMESLVDEMSYYDSGEDFKRSNSDGYDSVIVLEDEEMGGRSYSVFNDNQIKSATENNGGFSSHNDDIRFREVKDKNGEKSLVGLHNISEEKLRKALRQGGFANPSAAVIDISRQSHTGYGSISLVLPSSMIEKRTGKNAGTWSQDAWTPIYPTIERQFSGKGSDAFSKDLQKLPEEMRSTTKSGMDSYMDGRGEDSLAYMYLYEQGKAPELARTKPSYPEKTRTEVEDATNGSFSMSALSDKQLSRLKDAYMEYKGFSTEGYNEAIKLRRAKLEEAIGKMNPRSILYEKRKTDLERIDKYGFDYSAVESFMKSVRDDISNSDKVDAHGTMRDSWNFIEENGMRGDFNKWLDKLNERYGIKEIIFNGFTPSGIRKYIPNTLENVSKFMKKQGRSASVGIGASFQNFAASLLDAKGSLKDIRKDKGKLTTDHADVDAFRDKWSKVFHELGEKLQPDAKGYDDYGLYRLAEAARSKDPQKYIKEEYGIDFSDEDVKTLNEMVDAIRNEYPAMYFETKFERPVYLEEFAAAVVPDNVDGDIRKAIYDAGLKIFTYKADDEISRNEAVKQASEIDGVRFRSIGEKGAANLNKAETIEFSINDWSAKLNTPVRVIHDVDDITDTDENMLARKRDSKGWYDTSTGEIVIVSPNSTSVGDAQRTFLHEVVGHHGLRELFGDDFDTFLDNVYRNANEDIRKNIIDRTKGNPLNLREATEEYIAELAERGFDNKAERSLWEKIKDAFLDMLRKADISLDFKLSDNDLRYILWRSYKNLEQGNLMDVAEDIVMRNRLSLNNINLNENGSIARDIEPEKGKQPSETKGTGRELETIDGVDENGNESERDHIDKPRGVENAIDGTENATDRNGKKTDGQVDNDGDQLGGGDTGDRNGSVRDGIGGERTVIGRAGSENKGRGVGESVREKTDDFAFAEKTIRFRENARNESVLFADNDIQVVEKQVGSAKDQYERTLSTSSYQFQEAFQDSMLGLKTLQDAVAKATRSRILDYENAYMAENALSSVNEAEFNAYRKAAFEPILKAISRLEKMGSSIDEIRDYLITKHGIERNREMAVKRALSQNAETYKSLLDEYIGRRNEIRENGGSWEEQQSEMDRLAEEYGANLSDDFSGFTSMYPNEDNTGYDPDSARRYVLDYESRYDTSELSASVKRATDAILAKQRDSGLMSQNTFDSISDMYQFYVPLRGWEETTADEVYAYLTSESQTFNAPIKTVVGRKSKADDPIATIANMAESGIMQGNRNLMKQKFLTMVQNHKTDLVSVSEMWVRLDEASGEWIAVFPDIPSNANPEQVESIVESFNKRMEELSNEKGSNVRRSRDAIGIPYKILPKDLKEHQVIVKRAGKEYVLTINGNPRAAQALNGLTNPDNTKGWFGTLERYAGWLNRNLAANFTTRNPNFMVSNFLRDALYSNTTVWVKESPVYAWKFNKNFAKVNPINMYRLVKGYENGTLDMSDPLNKAYHDFVMRGGETGYTNLRDVEAKKKAIQKELQYSKQKVSIGKALKILGEWMDLFNKSVENCARFAAFLTSREIGRSMDKSIYDAKEISVNFNKKGAGSKFLNTEGQTKIGNASAFTSGLSRSMYVFWNAGVQGMYNFGRLAKDNPKKFLGLASSFYLLGTIMPMIAAVFGDDEDDDYYDLPEYVRRNNICFRNGGGNWITIPMPIELRAIYGLGEMSSGIVSGKEKYTDKKMAMKIAEQMSQVLPLDMMEGGGGFSAFVPSSVKPLIEAGDNKDWTGLPLYKDNDFNKGMPEWTKAFKSVDPAILAMTKYANELTGGDKYTTGTVNLNPAIIEHILDGYFGGIEATRSQMVKSAETAWGSRDFDWRNIPVGNRLIKSGDERTKKKAIDNAYYENLEEMEKIGQRLRGYRKELSNPQNDSFDMAEYQKKLNDLMMSDEYRRYIEFNNLNKLYQSMGEYLKKVDDERLEMELYDLKAMMNEIANGE
ncbi:LPD38 domain-containing protein [Parabacteroides distasonis]|uniref:LPD38 domain-containing protein n=1 Tax=Parabacteroides distasonis TaxID=823 RepID=UPI0032C002A0